MKRLTPNEEHAHAIASAVSDLIAAQCSQMRDRDRVIEGSYNDLVARIAAALDSTDGKIEGVRFEARGMPVG